MWPWVLGSAALGGLQAYQKSGGDIGKTLAGATIGGGLGALVPGVGRLAGTALEGTGLLAPVASGLTSAAIKGRQLMGLAGPAQAVTSGQLARLAGGGATLLAGGAVPGIAASLSGAPGQAAKAATGAAGLARTATFQPGELGGGPQYPTGAAPDVSQYNYPGLVTQQNPMGPWQANIQYQKQLQDLENQNVRRLANYQLLASDEVRKREFQRNAAAAQLSTMLATNSQMQLQSQQNAAAQAQQALASVGQIAGTQYRYL